MKHRCMIWYLCRTSITFQIFFGPANTGVALGEGFINREVLMLELFQRRHWKTSERWDRVHYMGFPEGIDTFLKWTEWKSAWKDFSTKCPLKRGMVWWSRWSFISGSAAFAQRPWSGNYTSITSIHKHHHQLFQPVDGVLLIEERQGSFLRREKHTTVFEYFLGPTFWYFLWICEFRSKLIFENLMSDK